MNSTQEERGQVLQLWRYPAAKVLVFFGGYATVNALWIDVFGTPDTSIALFLSSLVGGFALYCCFRRFRTLAFHLVLFCMSFLFCTEISSGSPLISSRTDLPQIRCGIDGRVLAIMRQDSQQTSLLMQARVKLRGLAGFDCPRVLVRIWGKSSLELGDYLSLNGRARPARVAHLPLEFDEVAYIRSQAAILLADVHAGQVRVVRRGWSFSRIAARWAQKLEQHIHNQFRPATSAFAVALLTGNRHHITAERGREFVRSGTAHVLALSGMHVLLIASLLLIPLAYLPNRVLQWIVLAVILSAFCMMSGMRESTVRAVSMFLLWRGLACFERRPQLLNILCLTAISLLLLEPQQIQAIGFQLSFAAVAGIALFYAPLQSAARRWWPRTFLRSEAVQNSLCLSLAVGVPVNIIIAYHFAMFSLIALLANVLVIPLIMLAMVQAIAALLVGILLPDVAALLIYSFDFLMHCTVDINSFLANLPGAAVENTADGTQTAMLYACVMSVATLWCLPAARRYQAFSRLMICAGTLTVLLCLGKRDLPVIEVIPRSDCVAAVIRSIDTLGRRHVSLLLVDRHLDMVYSRRDAALLQYCLHGADSLQVICLGPGSVAQWRGAPITGVGRILTGPLTFKRRDMFAALDSLAAARVEVMQLSPDTDEITLADFGGGLRVKYKLQSNVLEFEDSENQTRNLCLPRCTRHWTLEHSRQAKEFLSAMPKSTSMDDKFPAVFAPGVADSQAYF